MKMSIKRMWIFLYHTRSQLKLHQKSVKIFVENLSETLLTEHGDTERLAIHHSFPLIKVYSDVKRFFTDLDFN